MIIYTESVDYKFIKNNISNTSVILTYVDSLVPKWACCIPYIVDNQKYYVALHLRKLVSIPYKLRMGVVEELVKNIRLGGVISEFTTFDEILEQCNTSELIDMLKNEYE